jgi:hypothetical protein
LNLNKFYYVRLHTRCYKVTISLLSKVENPLYHQWQCCLLGSQQQQQIFVWQNSCSIDCARYFIRQHSRFARLLSPVCVFDCRWLWERQCQSNTLTIREVCCSLVFVLLYSEFNELTLIYRYNTVSIRVYQIEPILRYLYDIWEKIRIWLQHKKLERT